MAQSQVRVFVCVCVCVSDINAFIAQSTLKERERTGKVRQQLKGMETKNHRFDDLIIEETIEEGWLTAGRREERPHGLQRQLVAAEGVTEWEVGTGELRRATSAASCVSHIKLNANWLQGAPLTPTIYGSLALPFSLSPSRLHSLIISLIAVIK